MGYYLSFADEEWDRQILNDTSTFFQGPLQSVKEINTTIYLGEKSHCQTIIPLGHGPYLTDFTTQLWRQHNPLCGCLTISQPKIHFIVILKWWFLLLLPIPNKAEDSAKRQVCIWVQIYALAGKPNWWPRARLFVFSSQWFPQWFRWQISFKVGGIKEKNPWIDHVNVTQLLERLSQHLHVMPTMRCIQTTYLQCHHWYSVTLAIMTRGQRQNDFRKG